MSESTEGISALAVSRAAASGLTFGELRRVISRTDRLSMLCGDGASYENYRCIGEVPHEYDDMAVCGIGLVDSEFQIEGDYHPREARENGIGNGMFLGRCIEVWVAKADTPSLRMEVALSCMNRADGIMGAAAEGLTGDAARFLDYACADLGRAVDELNYARMALGGGGE